MLCPFIWLVSPAWDARSDAVELTLRGWLHFSVHGLRPYWFKNNYGCCSLRNAWKLLIHARRRLSAFGDLSLKLTCCCPLSLFLSLSLSLSHTHTHTYTPSTHSSHTIQPQQQHVSFNDKSPKADNLRFGWIWSFQAFLREQQLVVALESVGSKTINKKMKSTLQSELYGIQSRRDQPNKWAQHIQPPPAIQLEIHSSEDPRKWLDHMVF